MMPRLTAYISDREITLGDNIHPDNDIEIFVGTLRHANAVDSDVVGKVDIYKIGI